VSRGWDFLKGGGLGAPRADRRVVIDPDVLSQLRSMVVAWKAKAKPDAEAPRTSTRRLVSDARQQMALDLERYLDRITGVG
jgi:hypothetical protein